MNLFHNNAHCFKKTWLGPRMCKWVFLLNYILLLCPLCKWLSDPETNVKVCKVRFFPPLCFVSTFIHKPIKGFKLRFLTVNIRLYIKLGIFNYLRDDIHICLTAVIFTSWVKVGWMCSGSYSGHPVSRLHCFESILDVWGETVGDTTCHTVKWWLSD